MAANPLRYSPDIEQPDADEQHTIDGIIKGMTEQSQAVEKREHHAVRASHAKSSALVTGTLEVLADLPAELAQGLFAKPGRYSVAVRFAQGPGETLGDRVSTHRGMSIKAFGVEGEKLPGHATDTQDFVFASGPTFPSGTAKGFLKDGSAIGKSATMRGFNALLHTVGAESPKADFFGHPFTHPLSEPYFSQAPVRYGDYVAKLAAFPASHAQDVLKRWRLDPHQDESGFRHAAVSFFDLNEVVFEIKAQLWTDARTQPIEDASKEWSVDESAYRTVAVLRLPAQKAYGAERQQYFDERLTFSPAHSLAAHRPLGSVMRARLQVYQALSDFRQRENGAVAAHPTSLEEVPA